MSPDEAALAAGIDAVEALGPLDPVAMADAAAILDALTKPPGSLGRLEDLVVQLAGITATSRPTLRDRAIVVAAADHGVARQGVSAYPAEVTTQMVGNFLAGGAAINTLGAIVGASLTVIDVGVAGSIPDAAPEGGHGARLIRARVRPGTADMTIGAAMSRAEALRAIAVGLAASRSLRASGVELIAVGEMGIGNTTAASAITAAMTGLAAGARHGPRHRDRRRDTRAQGRDRHARPRSTPARPRGSDRRPRRGRRARDRCAGRGAHRRRRGSRAGRARRLHHRCGGAPGGGPRAGGRTSADRRPSQRGAGPRDRPGATRPEAGPGARPSAGGGDRRRPRDHRHRRRDRPARRHGDVRIRRGSPAPSNAPRPSTG